MDVTICLHRQQLRHRRPYKLGGREQRGQQRHDRPTAYPGHRIYLHPNTDPDTARHPYGYAPPTPTAKANPTATSAPTRTPTPTTSPTPTGPDLKIAHVFHDGVYSSQEPDEYVEIINLGNLPASLDGWTLSDIDDGTPVFVFTTGFVAPGGVIRVYTNQIHPEWGGYSFGRGTAIWNNCDPDTAGLADPDGVVVSTKTYSSEC